MKTFYPACVACAAVTLLAAGCMSSMPPGTTVFHVMYQQEQGTETLGVPNTLTSIGLLAEKCVIWSDIYGQSPYEPKGYRCSGSHIASDGRRLDWQCETKDGCTFGQIVIDSQTYDLSKGRLFLVSTRGGTTKVRQLNPDPANLDLVGLMDLTKKDSTIRDYFTSP